MTTVLTLPQSEASLFFDRDAQRFHLAVEVAALETEHLGCASYVAVILIELLEDKISLVSVPSLVQRRELVARCAPVAVAINQWRQVLAVEPRGHGIHDHDAFDHIAQFADIARP